MPFIKKNLTVIIFVSIIISGIIVLQWLSRKIALVDATNGAPKSVAGTTHADSKPHPANFKSFGDYHVEAQVDSKGNVKFLLYAGMNANNPDALPPLMPLSTLGWDLGMGPTADIIVTGEDSIHLSLTPKPMPGEPSQESSRFVGAFERRPDQQVGLALNIKIDKENYRVQWRPEELVPGAWTSEGGDVAMPKALGSQESQSLFLTPGGLYTEADIAANGKTTATQKYGSQMSTHNAKPQKGDTLCPISETVANPKFVWIIGGKTYTFCCPPCIEEFLKRAKEEPQKIQSPDFYIKK
jgi:YHS domain-containing protein